MRRDMAKVVTEAPRRGHANPSRKWGRRLRKDEYELDDHGPTRVSSARRRQYTNWKDFSDDGPRNPDNAPRRVGSCAPIRNDRD